MIQEEIKKLKFMAIVKIQNNEKSNQIIRIRSPKTWRMRFSTTLQEEFQCIIYVYSIELLFFQIVYNDAST